MYEKICRKIKIGRKIKNWSKKSFLKKKIGRKVEKKKLAKKKILQKFQYLKNPKPQAQIGE